MAFKRSRATFEADLQVQESPYVIYGTPLPTLDQDARDDGSYVPLWKQEVTDEQGRKRLHGAFTGGFSAGYFNTVGSKEGWTPSTFVSSRSNRNHNAAIPQQRPEDFMDEEDMAEVEEVRKLQTKDTFAGFSIAAESGSSGDSFLGLFRPTGETMGMKLLKKMGWREGQGIGPKVRRKARVDDTQGGEMGQFLLFAPEDSQKILFQRKIDRKGLGFEVEEGVTKASHIRSVVTSGHSLVDRATEDAAFESLTNPNKLNDKKLEVKGGLGVGVLNDNGSDDEDPYVMGPQISYNQVIRADKKKKKRVEASRPTANPLLNSKPIFISKRTVANKASSGFRRCHDGRLPIHGFVLATNTDPLNSILSQDGEYPPPSIPAGWRSSKVPSDAKLLDPVQYLSSAEVAAAYKLSPKSRAALLGETQLPGKSVFDYLTPNARSRIASATHNQNLPPALGEAEKVSPSFRSRTLQSLVPPLLRETAIKALGRGSAGWMPYAEDPAKRARYQSFLEIRASMRAEGTLPDRAPGASNDDWAKEMNEFAHAAQIFKPMTGMMATRFTSSSSAPNLASDNVKLEGNGDGDANSGLLAQPSERTKTPAEEAAALGMYGPLTRSVEKFIPTRLLCKRFNVKPPVDAQINSDNEPVEPSDGGVVPLPTYSASLPQKRLELVGKKDMDDLKMSGDGGVGGLPLVRGRIQHGEDPEVEQEDEAREMVVIDPERNEALEKERPGEAVFRAIFGSDSEAD
ncbi:MAG: hypothetical protein Q9217_000781 [Psora testacea]